MNSKRRYNIAIPLFYFFFFGAQCLVISYMNVYLEKHLVFTGKELGLYTSITPLIPAVIIPLVGILCDRTQRYKEIFLIFLGLTLASAGFMSRQSLLPLVILAGAGLETARAASTSLADAQATSYCADSGKNYGLFRIGGSIGWVACGLLVGALTTRIPLSSLLFPAFMLLMAVTLLAALLFPNIRNAQKPAAEKNAPISELFKNRPYVAMLLVTIVVCIAGEISLSYAGNHLVTTMKSPESMIGLNTAFAVVPEFFFFPAATVLLKKYGFKKMYILAAVGVTLRFAIYFFAGSPYVFLLGSLLHCLGSGCFTAVDLAFIHKSVKPSQFGTAVTLLGTVATLARAFFGYMYGYIYENFGSRYIFLSVIPLAVLVLIYTLRTRLFDENPADRTA